MDAGVTTPGPTPTRRRGTDRVPLAHRAQEELRAAIVDGRLPPGTPLIEADLVERLGMSKTPVREALRLLAHTGLITTDSFRTWRVRSLSEDDVRNIFDVRAILESTAISRACERTSTERRVQVRSLMDDIEDLAGQSRRPTLASANRSLHAALIADCGNQEIVDVVSSYGDRLTLAVVRGWQRQDTSMKELREHRAIVEAYVSGDAALAGALMRDHIEGFARIYGGEQPGDQG